MQGFLFHPTLAVTPDRLCLGVVHTQIWVREERSTKKECKLKDIKDKESNKWLNSFKHTKELAKSSPDTTFINIGDREGDIYEFFLESDESLKNAQWIIRSTQNRKLADGSQKLWDKVRSTNSIGEVEFVLPEGRGRKSRKIKQEIRVATVELKAPLRHNKELENTTITIVLASEVNPPEGEKPVEWLLLTSLDVNDYKNAIKVIEYYLCRWQIELYFKALKSGCKIEKLQLESLDRIEKCFAIYMIIAWRILFTTMLGRIAPEMLCDCVFSESEWKSVYMVTHKEQPPKTAPSLNTMIKMVAQLGGFLNRNSDGDPGIKTVWIGMQRMRDFALSWEAFQIVAEKTYG
jgi:hypothetical protein